MVRRALLAAGAAVVVLGATAGVSAAQTGPPQPDPAGVLDLPAGFRYTPIARSCVTQVRSTESGLTFPMPDDPDGKALFRAPGGKTQLLVQHELTQPRPGDFQGDAGKCFVPEQTPGDDDSDGWGAISRLTLGKDGKTLLDAELITTGLHDLCASTVTPWNTYLTNEEFPFLVDPDRRSGWV